MNHKKNQTQGLVHNLRKCLMSFIFTESKRVYDQGIFYAVLHKPFHLHPRFELFFNQVISPCEKMIEDFIVNAFKFQPLFKLLEAIKIVSVQLFTNYLPANIPLFRISYFVRFWHILSPLFADSVIASGFNLKLIRLHSKGVNESVYHRCGILSRQAG